MWFKWNVFAGKKSKRNFYTKLQNKIKIVLVFLRPIERGRKRCWSNELWIKLTKTQKNQKPDFIYICYICRQTLNEMPVYHWILCMQLTTCVLYSVHAFHEMIKIIRFFSTVFYATHSFNTIFVPISKSNGTIFVKWWYSNVISIPHNYRSLEARVGHFLWPHLMDSLLWFINVVAFGAWLFSLLCALQRGLILLWITWKQKWA